MASASIQTDIEQIVSPKAVSESGPGADLYTYVVRREPRVTSQQPSPANSAPQNATAQPLHSPKDVHSNTLESQTSQDLRETVAQPNTGPGSQEGNSSMPNVSSFDPIYARGPENLPSEQLLHEGFDQHLGTGTGDMQRQAETMQIQMEGSNPNIRLYVAPMIPQTTSLEQGGVFRPMMDGFDTVSGMMSANMDLDYNDDDLWWTHCWGSVRIL